MLGTHFYCFQRNVINNIIINKTSLQIKQIFQLIYHKMILTESDVRFRRSLIQQSSIHYDFILNLNQGTTFQGISTIKFHLHKNIQSDKQLFLDYSGNTVHFLAINGVIVHEIRRKRFMIFLQTPLLKFGSENVIEVYYESVYDNDSNGLISFRDRQNSQYLYTIFQPYNAHRVFPLFDQCNLKAQMILTVIVPKVWNTVISNELPSFVGVMNEQNLNSEVVHKIKQSFLMKEISMRDDEPYLVHFSETQLLPPHVFCINAGPFKMIELNAAELNIPMRLFCSKSNFQILKKMKDLLEEITIKSMHFFNNFFGFKYPFKKYDQIFPGQYEKIAMQNAASSIFTDSYLHDPSLVSHQKRFWMINTMIHQLAHHWFGNVITAQWWEDIWIHQGFAEFFGFYCLQKIKEDLKHYQIQSSMTYFIETKEFGFHAEGLSSAQPVQAKISNISEAVAIFERVGISYTKGASLLNQILLIVGEQNFSFIICNFIKKSAFNNSRVDDFFKEVQQFFPQNQFGISLEKWKRQWFETKSFNVVECKMLGRKIIIKQHPDAFDQLRFHKMKIAFIDSQMSISEQDYLIKPCEETEMIVERQFSAIIPNYGCYTYAEQRIDKDSIEFLLDNYPKITDPLIKVQLWKFLFKQTQRKNLMHEQFIKVVLKDISEQSSDCVLEWRLKLLTEMLSLSGAQQNQLSSTVFISILKQAQNFKKQNMMLIISENISNFAKCKEHFNELLKWINGQSSYLQSIKINYETQWAILKKLIQLQASRTPFQDHLQRLISQDLSDRVMLQLAEIQSMLCSKQEIQKIYNSFKDQNCESSVTLKKAKYAGWIASPYTNQIKKCLINFHKDVCIVKNTLKHEHFDFFINSVFPKDFDDQNDLESLKSINLEGEEFSKNTEDLLNLLETFYPEK